MGSCANNPNVVTMEKDGRTASVHTQQVEKFSNEGWVKVIETTSSRIPPMKTKPSETRPSVKSKRKGVKKHADGNAKSKAVKRKDGNPPKAGSL